MTTSSVSIITALPLSSRRRKNHTFSKCMALLSVCWNHANKAQNHAFLNMVFNNIYGHNTAWALIWSDSWWTKSVEQRIKLPTTLTSTARKHCRIAWSAQNNTMVHILSKTLKIPTFRWNKKCFDTSIIRFSTSCFHNSVSLWQVLLWTLSFHSTHSLV
jgi:hypothetical protein